MRVVIEQGSDHTIRIKIIMTALLGDNPNFWTLAILHGDMQKMAYRVASWKDYATSYKNRQYQVVPIDLGLSVKWANTNLQAADETKPGLYVSWGETKSKLWYLPNTYAYDGLSCSELENIAVR